MTEKRRAEEGRTEVNTFRFSSQLIFNVSDSSTSFVQSQKPV